MPGSASPGRSSPDAAAALIWSTSWRKTGPPDLKETRNCMAWVSLIGQGGDGVKRFVCSGPARPDRNKGKISTQRSRSFYSGHRVFIEAFSLRAHQVFSVRSVLSLFFAAREKDCD